jgi:hypothetical protein
MKLAKQARSARHRIPAFRLASMLGFSSLLVAAYAFGQVQARPPLQGSTLDPLGSIRVDKTRAAHDNFVGDTSCGSCHRDIFESFHHTAHYLTSRLPDQNSILGKFTPNANVLRTSNPNLFFRMDAKTDGFFETAVTGVAPHAEEHTEPISLVTGSGGKGQTYLFWSGDRLFQLPVSFWNQVGWVNSPGYRDGIADFARPIVPRCLECHATYFESMAPPPNRYNRTGFVVGITCEKCHGWGREHVQRESSKLPGAADAGILNPARFSRDRQIDLCAWCHAGRGLQLAATFSYVPGEPLDSYLGLPQFDPAAAIDVHGNQVGLLQKSRCFQSSAMTCLTCHDVHASQHDPQAFSQRCLGCHKPGTGMFPKLGHQVASNCISCHMPMQETNLIVFDQKGEQTKPRVRTHWIKIYPEATASE